MNQNRLLVLAGLVLLAACLTLVGCTGDKEEARTSTPGMNAHPTDDPCNAPADWFTSPPQAPDFSKFPPNAKNCDFHLWAWQEFLYLTTPDSNGQRPFEALALPSSLFVTSGEPGDYPGTTAEAVAKRVLQPRQLKVDQTESDIGQAGGGVLFDQQKQVVYYEARINKVYYDFIKKNKYYDPKNTAAAPAGTQFEVSSELMES